MSKTKSPTGIAWGKASDELIAKVKFVLQMAQSNRYSVSRIYAAHNAVFELSEQPQTCSTCLTSRAAALRKWWSANAPKDGQTTEDNAKAVPTTGEKHTPPIDDEQAAATLIADKLAELGITDDSSEADLLEAYEVLGAADGNTEPEAAIIAKWLEGAKGKQQDDAPAAAEPKTFVIEKDALGLVFAPSAEDANKGAVTWSDGTKVKAGTYTSLDGVNIAVQVGSRATIKA